MPTLYTLGYEGSSLERFLDTLQVHQISQVLDIRRVPWSRKPGFSKKALSGHLAAAELSYQHVVELGTPAELRAQVKQDHDYPAFFQGFQAYLADHDEAVAAVADLAMAQPSVLICFERNPHTCHRLVVGEAIVRHQPLLELVHLSVLSAEQR